MATSLSPIYASLRQASMVDYPGRLAAVLFTTGCNFRCGFCHNAALLGTMRPGYPWERLEALCEDFRRQWVRAVVVTGGEPTLAPALLETLAFFRERGFEVKLDTNGSRPAVLAEALPLVDFVAMDVKCSLPRYPEFVGFHDTAAIQESIAMLLASGKPCEFRTTLVEAVHTDAEMLAIREMIRGAPVYAVQAFLPHEDLPDLALRTTARTRPQALRHAADIVRPMVQRVEIRGD